MSDVIELVQDADGVFKPSGKKEKTQRIKKQIRKSSNVKRSFDDDETIEEDKTYRTLRNIEYGLNVANKALHILNKFKR